MRGIPGGSPGRGRILRGSEEGVADLHPAEAPALRQALRPQEGSSPSPGRYRDQGIPKGGEGPSADSEAARKGVPAAGVEQGAPVKGISLAALLLLLVPAASGYPDNLAWRLVTEGEVQRITGCEEPLENEQSEADPLYEPPRMPLAEIEPYQAEPRALVPPPRQWEVPPWPTVDPALPRDMPPEAAERLRERERPRAFEGIPPEEKAPLTWSDLPPVSNPAPSALLRPRPAYRTELLPQSLMGELPRPFSLRRYHTRDRGFFQIALYGGETLLTTERTFRILKGSLLDRTPVEGIGEEAFLARLSRPGHRDGAAEASPARPQEGVPFASIPADGSSRGDLLDRGLPAAQPAPAWPSIPVYLQTGAGSEKEPPRSAPEGERPPPSRGILVLVAHLPAKNLVLELLLDERIGDTQSLIEIAMLVQRRLIERW